MMTNEVKARITVDDLAALDDQWIEVKNGELVEVETSAMGLLHTVIIENILDTLKPSVRTTKCGYIHGDGLKYILHVDEQGVQVSVIPDAAFLRTDRLSTEFDSIRPFVGAPDFAVEIVSPGQAMPDVLDKIADYLRYGTEEVWLIFQVKRELHRYRQDWQAPESYKVEDGFEAAPLFPA
ncbi:MAG: Uma2 family endonuclease [bacterium]|nr:Uma2 family endonuclease [bacterium]